MLPYCAVAVLVLGGCAPQLIRQSATFAAQRPASISNVVSPTGWVMLGTGNGVTIFTRDGTPVQSIAVVQRSHEAFFRQTKHKPAANALPQEVAEAVVAETRTFPGRASLIVKSTEPFMLGGQPAFRVHTEHRNERGAPYESVLTGFSQEDEIVLVAYQALARNFFKRDLAAYDELLKGLAISVTPPQPPSSKAP
jgi:hypothetical protein